MIEPLIAWVGGRPWARERAKGLRAGTQTWQCSAKRKKKPGGNGYVVEYAEGLAGRSMEAGAGRLERQGKYQRG